MLKQAKCLSALSGKGIESGAGYLTASSYDHSNEKGYQYEIRQRARVEE